MQFAIMVETTSDNAESLRLYFDGTNCDDSCTMLPTIYTDFAKACKVASHLTESMLTTPNSHHIAEFSVVHSGDIVTSFYVAQLKHTWE